MKKLDKLILKSFFGPFILTFVVVVFILLMVQMLKYFDDIIGKDLGLDVIAQLLFYFAVFTTPTALPLAVLLSCLMAFGNLGEHFELTAIKSAGISLVRALVPLFVVVCFLTVGAFYLNNNMVPKAALEAYSLLYDIKRKKPGLELSEGVFYNGIPDISIKVDKKFSDDEAALKGVLVYDHTGNDGNKEVFKADSGRMYTILNEQYVKFELFDGYNYSEGASEERQMGAQKTAPAETLSRTRFEKTQIVFDLSSFDLERTDQKWFQGNRIMRNLAELESDIDSVSRDILQQRLNHYFMRATLFSFMGGSKDKIKLPEEVEIFKIWRDSVDRMNRAASDSAAHMASIQVDSATMKKKQVDDGKAKKKRQVLAFQKMMKAGLSKLKTQDVVLGPPKKQVDIQKLLADEKIRRAVDSFYTAPARPDLVQSSANMARQVKSQLYNTNSATDISRKELRIFEIQWHKILASSLACVAMFLVGAPLGSIIKKGGLGVPFLVAIFFFIVYYLLSMQGEKLAKNFVISPAIGVWAADFILLIVGLIFLRQARVDARLFDADAYRVALDKLKRWIENRKRVRVVEPS